MECVHQHYYMLYKHTLNTRTAFSPNVRLKLLHHGNKWSHNILTIGFIVFNIFLHKHFDLLVKYLVQNLRLHKNILIIQLLEL